MNKQRWVYIGEEGKRSTIGIIHNAPKGQFMIYCNKKIVLVEFKLFDSKEFSFFLDDELCKVKVIREGNQFRYEFGVDLKTETPLNLERRTIERKERRNSVLAIIIGLTVVSLIIGGGIFLHRQQLKKKRQKNGVFAVATVNIFKKPQSYSLVYSFPTQYGEHVRQVEYYKHPNPMSPNGFPFHDGDEFSVQYSRFKPDNHEVFYHQPTELQIDRYKERAAKVHLDYHPFQNEAYCNCLVNAAFDIKGLDGLLYFYHQEQSPSKNKSFNIKKYKEFIISKEFKDQTEVCGRFVE